MTKKQEVALKLLKGARKQIAKRGGWNQGSYVNEKGGCCLIGAMNKAAWEEDLFTPVSQTWSPHEETDMWLIRSGVSAAALGTKREYTKRLGTRTIADWNDTRKTKKEVLDYLDERIRILEAA